MIPGKHMTWLVNSKAQICLLLVLNHLVCDGRNVPSHNKVERSVDPIGHRLRHIMHHMTKEQLEGFHNIAGEILQGIVQGDDLDLFKTGSKWNGAINAAQDNKEVKSSECWKNHDNCFDQIGAFEEKEGLINSNPFIMNHCQCEHGFFHCLKSSDSSSTFVDGFLYFNVLRRRCFTFDFPIIQCRRYGLKYPKTEDCQDYELNVTLPQEWQTRDALDWSE